MTDPIVITRDLVKRGWTDFEPKVITGLLSGSIAAFVTSLLGTYGVHLSQLQTNALVVGFYFIGAYLTPSSGTTITRTVENAAQSLIKEIEEHRGPVVTTVTASTPIIHPTNAPSFTAVLAEPTADAKPTEVIPTGASAFLAARASRADSNYPESDGH